MLRFIILVGFVLFIPAAWSQGLQVVPTVVTVAGNGTGGFSGDGGAATSAELYLPLAILHDTQGNYYIADYYNNRVRKVTYATGVISTIAGNGTGGYSGDGVQATATEINGPSDLALDGAGNLYIADSYNNRVRKVNLSTGIISTFAGTGTGGYSGDSGLATNAKLNYPSGLAFDSLGDLYIADADNFRVRKVSVGTGIITTAIGNGTDGSSGDGGLATSAEIGRTYGFSIDSSNNLYLSDGRDNNKVRFISASTGKISTFAGSGVAGFSGDGGVATSAKLNLLDGTTALDGTGSLYITDESNNRIRVVNLASGIIDTITGTGAGTYTGDGGPASTATFNAPQRIEVARSGVVYIADSSNNVVRTLTTAMPVFPATQVGATSQQNILLEVKGAATSISSFSFTVAQGSAAEYIVGTVTGCTVNGSTLNPVGTICTIPVTFQPAYPGLRQSILLANTNGGTIRFGVSGTGEAAQVSLTPGTLSTVAGTGTSGNTGNGGAATSATLNQPSCATVDSQGNLFIADTGNNVVRAVTASSGNIALLAGNGTSCATPTATCGDGGAASSANLANPASVGLDAAENYFIADSGDNRIRRVDGVTGVITTVAGTGGSTYAGDGGAATSASIGNPQQVIVDASGNLYIAAAGDNAVRFVSATSGIITTIAGTGAACSSATAACGDGGAATAAQLSGPTGIARDAAGDLYIADSGDNRVRRVDATTGVITTVVGTGTAGYTGDGAAATSATLNAVNGVDIDPAGNLYLADLGNAAIRLVLAGNGTIQTIAGNGTACASATASCGDGVVSSTASLISPRSAALDSFGNVYIADSGENRIREVYVVQPTFTFATVNAGFNSSSNPESVLVTNIGNQPLTAAVPSSGTNPAFTTGFSDDSSSSCPLLTPSSSSATLPAGYGCTYGIDLRPTSAGPIAGSMTLSGNILNNPSGTQQLLLTGIASQIYGATTLTSSNTTPAYGDSIILTDSINVIDGIAPTGNVSFYDGSTLLGTVAATASGVETFALDSLPVGTDSITASYSGDTTYAAESSNTVVETVGDPATTATTTTLTSSVSPSNYGHSTTLTATVGYSGSGGVPTGSVTFYSPGASTAINLQATSSSTTYSQTLNLAAGTYSLSVLGNSAGGLYTGWNPASNPSTNDRWTDRYGIELCATCTALVNDIAGDPGYSTDVQALSAFQTVSTLNMTLNSLQQGQTVDNPYTFTLTSPQSVSFYVPDGNFADGAFTDTSSFADDTGGLTLALTPLTPLGTATVNSSGVAALSTTTLPVGTDSLQAVYSGDNTYVASPSAVINQVVNKAAASGTLTSSNTTPALGQSVTFTDTLPAVNGTYPTGTITFYNGSTSLGTGTLNNGVATLSTSALPAGTDTVTATFPGDTTFQSGTSNSVTETVGKSSSADALTASSTSPTLGQSVTFTDTIPAQGGIAPTGTVTFYDGTTIIGTGTVNSSDVATLTTGSLPAGTDSITAVYGGDSNYAAVTSNAVTETVAKSASADVLTSSNTTPTLGQSVTFTDTIPVQGGIAPTGTVTFYDGTTIIGTGMVNSSGVATLTTGSLPAGTDSISAVYSGDSNYTSVTTNAVTETVGKSSSADTLTASTTTPTLGQSVTFTDTIPVKGGIAPTGTITFYDGTTIIGTGTVNSSGVATLTTSSLPAGTDSITAVYGGDSNYAAVTSNAVTENVSKSSSANVLTSSNTTPTLGQSVTFTDTIPVQGGIAPTGTVTFYDGTTIIGTGTVNASGVATLTTGSLPAGTDSITAVYGGDSNYAAVTSNAVTETVAKAASADVLSSSNITPTLGQSVTFTDTVPVQGGIAPTGTVTFYDGTTIIGTGTVNASGVATLTTGSLPAGTDSITAVYGGDSNYAAVTSNAVTETVAKSSSADVLTSSNTTPTLGQSVTLTDTIPVQGGIAPTGTVTFYDGTTIIGTGTVNSSGVATLTTGSLPAGTDSITAVYGGDSNYAVVTSNAVTETVAKASGPDTLTASTTTTVFGQSVTLTYTIPIVVGISPTGTVTFYDGTTIIGTGTVNASGVATLTTAALPVGSDAVTAAYAGDSNYAAAAAGPLTITVVPLSATTSDVLTASATATTFGQSVTFTDTVSGSAATFPTGTVIFYDGSTVLGAAVPLSTTGTATLTTATLAIGSHSITAVYSGDSAYVTGTSNAVTVTVTQGDFTIAATPANQTVDPGQATSYTISLGGLTSPFDQVVILSATGLPPGASVSFSPASLTPGAGPTTTTMTIATDPKEAGLKHPSVLAGIAYALLLLPLLGTKRVRAKLRSLPRALALSLALLATVSSVGAIGAITGCGGGYFGRPPHQYTIIVTGTSGSLQHSTTVTLTVE